MASPFDLADYSGSPRQASKSGSPFDLADYSGFAPNPTVAPGRRVAKDILDMGMLGLQESSGGLSLRGKLPNIDAPDDAPWYMRLSRAAGGVVGDIPAMIGGAVAGTPMGGPVGSMVGSFAVPMALRDALVTAYNHDAANSWEGVKDIMFSALKGGGKGAVIGAATFGAGRAVGSAMAGASGRLVAAGTATAELTAMTATASALDGHLPTAQDFLDNALLLGGVKGVAHTVKALKNIYAETGKDPALVAGEAKANPEVLAAVQKGEMPPAYQQLAHEERVKAAIDSSKMPEIVKAVQAELDGKPAEAPKGAFRYEYVTGEADAKAVLKVIAEATQEAEKQRRGVVPNAQSVAEARQLIERGELKRREIGEAENASETAARAMLTRASAEEATALRKQWEATPAEQRTLTQELEFHAAMERTVLFYGELAGAGAEAGRTLQMLRAIKRNPDLIGDAKALVDSYNQSGKDIGTLTKMLRERVDPANLAKFAADLHKATTLEKVLEVYRANIYSGPLTTGANLIGNFGRVLAESVSKPIEATLFAADSALRGDPIKMAQWKARAFSPIMGFVLGVKDGAAAAAEVLRNQEVDASKVELTKVANTGAVGTYTRTVFSVLQAGDMLFRIPGERAQAHIMAVDRVVKDFKIDPTTTEGALLVAKLTRDPTLGLTEKAAQEVTKKIEKAGAQAVFSEALGPRFAKAQSAISGSVVQFLVPAFRTPVNLISYATQHIPGINFMSARWMADFKAGGERQAQAVARVALGTALMTWAYSLFEDGDLTGGGLFDKEMGGTKEGAGKQKYSLRLGGNYYSIERLEPISKPLMFAADIMEMLKSPKLEADHGKLAFMGIMALGNLTISTTYLSSLANVIKGLDDPQRFATNIAEGYGAAVVPKAIGQTVALLDDHKREVDGVFQAVASQLPYFREQLLPKIDVWGEEAKQGKAFGILPVAKSKETEDKVKSEALRLQFAIAPAPKFLTEKGPFKEYERKVEITQAERNTFAIERGSFAMELLAPIVNDARWDQTPDFVKGKMFRMAVERASKLAEMKAVPFDDPRRAAKREQLQTEIIKQSQGVSGN